MVFGERTIEFGSIKKKIGFRKGRIARFNFGPELVEIRAINSETTENISFQGEREAGKEIKKTVGVAADKIDVLAGKMVGVADGGGNIFPPALDSFGVVNPGTGQEAEVEIVNLFVKAEKTKFWFGTEGDEKHLPIFQI